MEVMPDHVHLFVEKASRMRAAFKYRLYPTQPQAAFLDGQLREACSLYNAAKQERDDAWKTCHKSINYYDQANQLKAMRAEGLIGLENFSCCQDVLRRVDKTYRAFYARVKRGDKPEFPRYRSARRYDSITFPTYGDGCGLLDSGKLRIQGAGQIKVKLHRPVEGTIKTVTIKREAGRWFAIFSVERDAVPLPARDRAIGIDVGLNSFATLSDGTEVPNPRHYRAAEARFRCAQRKVARRKNQRSNRRRKAVRLLQRAHANTANQRRDFQHKLSRQLVNEYGVIAVEDLSIQGLAGGMLAKSVHDAGWNSFMQKLSYKAECAGRVLVKVHPRGTSQTCLCGASVPKTLADRWHDCPACGLSAGRDVVSAQVILQRAGTRPSSANVEVVVSCVA
jgi:putative transposase